MTAQADVKRYELLIGGEAVPPGGGAYSSIIDPSTETPIASVAQGTAAMSTAPCRRRAPR